MQHVILNFIKAPTNNNVFQLSHANEFVIIMYKTDHVHSKWAQLALLFIQYHAICSKELFHASTGTLPGLDAKHTRGIAAEGRLASGFSQKSRACVSTSRRRAANAINQTAAPNGS